MSWSVSRRAFLRGIAGAAVAGPFTGIPAFAQDRKVRHVSIGAAGQALSDIRAFSSHPAFTLVAVSDVDLGRTEQVKKLFPEVRVYQDWREMFRKEQSNIDFALTASRAVRVSGTVLGLNGTPIQGMVNLAPAAFGDMSSGDRRVSTAADGTFALPNVTAGNYILEFTARVASQNALPEVAAVPLTVGSGDLSGLTITTSRGARVSGTIATDNGSRLEWAGIRATAPALRNTPGGFSPRVQVTSGATFELEGLIGAHTLRFDQLPAGWIVKSVTANSTDVTDVPLDFRGIEQVSVRVVLTDKVTNLTGTVTTDVSPRGASVVIFPDDKAKWTTTSRYVRAVRVADTGQFSTRGLPSGERYLVAALEYIENGEQLDPEFLERLKPIATSVSLAEGEQKQLNLALHPRK